MKPTLGSFPLVQYKLFVETRQTRTQSETIILSVQFPVLLNVNRIDITHNFSRPLCSTPLLELLGETLKEEEQFKGVGCETIIVHMCDLPVSAGLLLWHKCTERVCCEVLNSFKATNVDHGKSSDSLPFKSYSMYALPFGEVCITPRLSFVGEVV